jgi:hypothetical protein
MSEFDKLQAMLSDSTVINNEAFKAAITPACRDLAMQAIGMKEGGRVMNPFFASATVLALARITVTQMVLDALIMEGLILPDAGLQASAMAHAEALAIQSMAIDPKSYANQFMLTSAMLKSKSPAFLSVPPVKKA